MWPGSCKDIPTDQCDPNTFGPLNEHTWYILSLFNAKSRKWSRFSSWNQVWEPHTHSHTLSSNMIDRRLHTTTAMTAIISHVIHLRRLSLFSVALIKNKERVAEGHRKPLEKSLPRESQRHGNPSGPGVETLGLTDGRTHVVFSCRKRD